jgi:hypothetical protein
MLRVYDFDSEELDRLLRLLGAPHSTCGWLPVFYLDADGLEVMELPDGRRFEICWIPRAPSGKNYEIVRELNVRAA